MININTLEEKTKNISEDLSKEKKKSSNLSVLRLILSLAVIIFTARSFNGGINIFEGLVIAFGIGLFVFLVNIHVKIKKREKYLSAKIKVIEKYKLRMEDKWTNFEDIGEEGVDPEHLYTSNLDIFGKGSLFQLINCAKTFLGRKILIETLKGDNRVDNIKEKQLGVKELEDDLDFSIEVQTLGEVSIDKSNDPKTLIDYAKSKCNFKYGKVLKYIVYAMPVILILSGFLAYITSIKAFIIIALVAFIINIILNGYFLIKGYNGFSKVSPFKKNVKTYLGIIRLIENKDFKTKYLNDIQSVLKREPLASNVIKKLETIVDYIDLRYNAMAGFFLNLIFLWDYQCMFSLEDFKEKYGKKIEDYLIAIGKLEEVMSLCVVGQTNKVASFPLVNNSKDVFINAKDLGHPLIKQSARVNNDININDKILVITGSNMSGKTTFLRTIGINLVLAYSGAAVASKEFSTSYMEILTSMRIADNLEMGISTFYAELIRIKSIIEASKSNKPMIFLIDEIFRGTNSQDRIVGAINVIESLSKKGVIGCISTHDFELCDISDKKIENYHFEEHYKEGKILFDYKIKTGRSTTKNAKYLMRMVGINIEE